MPSLTHPRIEINGLNYELGLKQFSGSEAVYLKSLRYFADEFRSNLPSAQEWVDNHDWDAVCNHLHKLKGVTGNIAATRLYEQILTLRSYIDNNALSEFTEAWIMFCNQGKQLADSLEKLTASQDQDKCPPLSKSAVPEHLEMLGQLIQQHQIIPEDHLIALDQFFRRHIWRVQWSELRQALDSFNYPIASQSLEKLKQLIR
jgi:HPt (histidine-containing phosphotransfer) domain-containing protein